MSMKLYANMEEDMDEFNNQSNETTTSTSEGYTTAGYDYSGPVQVQPTSSKGKGLAIASLVCGICALVFMCCCTYIGIALGIAAIICGALSKNDEGKKSGMAIAGIICGAAAIVICIVCIVFVLAVGGGNNNALYEQLMKELN